MFENINLDYLDSLLADDLETKKTMLSMLLDEIPVEIDRLNLALNDKDYLTIKNATHKLKSTLAYVGNDKLTNANKAIEKIALEGTGYELLPALLEKMNSIYPAVVKDIKRACDQL